MTQDPFHASPIGNLNISSLGFLFFFFLFGFSYEQYVSLALKHQELVIPKLWGRKECIWPALSQGFQNGTAPNTTTDLPE